MPDSWISWTNMHRHAKYLTWIQLSSLNRRGWLSFPVVLISVNKGRSLVTFHTVDTQQSSRTHANRWLRGGFSPLPFKRPIQRQTLALMPWSTMYNSQHIHCSTMLVSALIEGTDPWWVMALLQSYVTLQTGHLITGEWVDSEWGTMGFWVEELWLLSQSTAAAAGQRNPTTPWWILGNQWEASVPLNSSMCASLSPGEEWKQVCVWCQRQAFDPLTCFFLGER